MEMVMPVEGKQNNGMFSMPPATDGGRGLEPAAISNGDRNR